MLKSTSTCVMIATMATPQQVPPTLTRPPVRTAPPMMGAAKLRISQSSPMEGWPNCRRATSMMPAMAARKPERACATITTRGTEMPDSSAAWALPPTARIDRPSGSRNRRYQSAAAQRTNGTTSHGIGPTSVALPSHFTVSGTS